MSSDMTADVDVDRVESGKPPKPTLLDKFMPIYDFNEVNSIAINASTSKIFKIIKEITPSEIPVFRRLVGPRLLPSRFVDKTGGLLTTPHPLFEQALRSGFVLLAENPNEEFVMGWVGQFWKLLGGSTHMISTADEFVIFDTPGYAKAAINFRMDPGNEATKVTTETRIYVTDPTARRKFAAYWLLIHPVSAFLRSMWLKAIKNRAERD